MQKFFRNNRIKRISEKNQIKNQIKKQVEEYILKYIKELQRHFDMSDNTIRLIVLRIYKHLAPKNFIQKLISVVKSKLEY